MLAGATDTHNHIVGPMSQYPMCPDRAYTPPEASLEQLRNVCTALGIERNVLVQPSVYGFDNACLLDALADLGGSARGVCVVPTHVSDEELHRLAALGCVGIRLNLGTAGITDPRAASEPLKAFAHRLTPIGWHIQIATSLPVINAIASMIYELDLPVVFDHFGGARPGSEIDQSGFGALLDLVRAGNAYVKLTAPYAWSQHTDWADVTPIARVLVATRPDRILWGTNWPHTGSARGDINRITPYLPINNQALLDAFCEWCPDDALRRMILVDNPARLYHFSPIGCALGEGS
jgi:predicted TIM-barrel fold metal-dependent hydrolase